jgi:hypothetical protein
MIACFDQQFEEAFHQPLVSFLQTLLQTAVNQSVFNP